MTETLILTTRPLTAEARRLTVENRTELATWVDGWAGLDWVRWYDTTEGKVRQATVNDWIVRTAFGSFEGIPDVRLFSEYDRVIPAVSE